mmetsp:Transcript_3165/g.7496  ORF Transcript_3165/g.7496 Transcript_3165/m.7496 type:complete len:223 (+) Transcript_3165:650-1318(+)
MSPPTSSTSAALLNGGGSKTSSCPSAVSPSDSPSDSGSSAASQALCNTSWASHASVLLMPCHPLGESSPSLPSLAGEVAASVGARSSSSAQSSAPRCGVPSAASAPLPLNSLETPSRSRSVQWKPSSEVSSNMAWKACNERASLEPPPWVSRRAFTSSSQVSSSPSKPVSSAKRRNSERPSKPHAATSRHRKMWRCRAFRAVAGGGAAAGAGEGVAAGPVTG